jgi:hypothetical protein
MTLTWYHDGNMWKGQDECGITVAHVQHADEGEAEGGLGALVRFMSGALQPGVPLRPPSPAGWYWQGTVTERGRWTRPAGPFTTPEAAIEACNAAPWTRSAG